MKTQTQIMALCLICISLTGFAEESKKASQMEEPISEPASKAAKKRAHQKVLESQKNLMTKLRDQESPAVIGNAKARVQIDRTESNRQDYLNQEKAKAVNAPPSEKH